MVVAIKNENAVILKESKGRILNVFVDTPSNNTLPEVVNPPRIKGII